MSIRSLNYPPYATLNTRINWRHDGHEYHVDTMHPNLYDDALPYFGGLANYLDWKSIEAVCLLCSIALPAGIKLDMSNLVQYALQVEGRSG